MAILSVGYCKGPNDEGFSTGRNILVNRTADSYSDPNESRVSWWENFLGAMSEGCWINPNVVATR